MVGLGQTPHILDQIWTRTPVLPKVCMMCIRQQKLTMLYDCQFFWKFWGVREIRRALKWRWASSIVWLDCRSAPNKCSNNQWVDLRHELHFRRSTGYPGSLFILFLICSQLHSGNCRFRCRYIRCKNLLNLFCVNSKATAEYSKWRKKAMYRGAL